MNIKEIKVGIYFIIKLLKFLIFSNLEERLTKLFSLFFSITLKLFKTECKLSLLTTSL